MDPLVASFMERFDRTHADHLIVIWIIDFYVRDENCIQLSETQKAYVKGEHLQSSYKIQ